MHSASLAANVQMSSISCTSSPSFVSSWQRASAENTQRSGTMFPAVPPEMRPTFAVVSSSTRPSRMSAIARAAAWIAERPSSGDMPACAARPWNVISIALRERRAEDDLADRAFLVVDEAELRAQARVVERGGADEADLLLPREHELDPRVRDALGEHAAHTLEHLRDRCLVVGAEDRAAGVSDDAVLDDRPQLAARRHRVEVGAEEEWRSLGGRLDPRVEVAEVVLLDGEAEIADDTRRRQRRQRPQPPGGDGIAASSRKNSVTPLTRRRARRLARAPGRGQRRRSRGTAAPSASAAT